jgi:hypothetical protein
MGVICVLYWTDPLPNNITVHIGYLSCAFMAATLVFLAESRNNALENKPVGPHRTIDLIGWKDTRGEFWLIEIG